jgi:hypothetical protein
LSTGRSSSVPPIRLYPSCSESLEVDQDQDGRTVGRRQGFNGADGSQRIIAAGIGRLPIGLAGDLQTPLDVEDGQPPLLLAAHLGDLGQGVVVLRTLNPDAGEGGGDVLGQALREKHVRVSWKVERFVVQSGVKASGDVTRATR